MFANLKAQILLTQVSLMNKALSYFSTIIWEIGDADPFVYKLARQQEGCPFPLHLVEK